MKYTTQEIRGAILRAADRIEGGAPYDFNGQGVTGLTGFFPACAPCMWGHIGISLGLDADSNHQIANAIGVEQTTELYEMSRLGGMCSIRADAAKILRAYANKFFPAPIVAEDRQLVPWASCPWSPKQAQVTP